MRITGGTLSGRKIEPPLSLTTRPMMDRVRQALFNILAHHDWGDKIGGVLDETHVLDAFCGTGALAFEALSYGAAHATLFDQNRQALQIATKNAASLDLQDKCAILSTDTLQPPRTREACKLVFLAPPYHKGLISPAMLALNEAGWIAKHALIMAETAKKEKPEIPEGFALDFSRSYGAAALHFIVR